MFTLTTQTLKPELLEFLARNAGGPDQLEIIVESLPIFLNSPVSFTIFLYQISSYPRPILWRATTQEIFNFLEQCDVTVVHDKPVDNFEVTPDYAQYENVLVVDNFSENTLHHIDFSDQNTQKNTPRTSVIDVNPYYFPSSQKQLIEATPVVSKIDFYEEIPDPVEESDVDEPVVYDENSKNTFQFQVTQQVSQQNFLVPKTYHPSTLISQDAPVDNSQKAHEIEELPVDNFSGSSHLDSFLQRVQSTQSTLKKMRQQDTSRLFQSNTKHTVQQKFSQRLSVGFYATIAGVLFVGTVFSAFFLFPTQAYTVEIGSQTEETQVDIELQKTDFNVRKASFTVTVDAQASGTTTQTTDRAKGKVKLVSSGRSCAVTNGSFYVLHNGLYYRHVQNSNFGQTIQIPENSNQTLQGIEVEVVAEASGAQFNVPAGTQFSVTNLRRGNVGTSCSAIASTEIKNVEVSGARVFSTEDQKSLIAKADGDLAIKRLQEITNLIDEKAYLDDQGNWFENLESEERFSHEIGMEAQTTTLTKTVTTDMYYLTLSSFEKKLQRQHPEMSKVVDVVMNRVTGSLIDENKVQMSLFVQYQKQNEIQTQDIQTMLQNGSTEAEIRQKYPLIQSIERKTSGISIPGLDPRINVQIEE